MEGYSFLDISFPVDIAVEAFVGFLYAPYQVQFHLGLVLPDPVPTQPRSTPTLVPEYLSLLPLPVHFLLAVQFDQQVLVQPCHSLAFLS